MLVTILTTVIGLIIGNMILALLKHPRLKPKTAHAFRKTGDFVRRLFHQTADLIDFNNRNSLDEQSQRPSLPSPNTTPPTDQTE